MHAEFMEKNERIFLNELFLYIPRYDARPEVTHPEGII